MSYPTAVDTLPEILLVAILNTDASKLPLANQIAALTRAGANAFSSDNEALRVECQRLGVRWVGSENADIAPIDSLASAWRALDEGKRILRFTDLLDADGSPGVAWSILRCVAPFVASFREVLNRGKITRNVKSVRGGLLGHETRTAQSGSILWLENPDPENAVTGSAFPVLPEITLGPNAVFPYVHDAPVGLGASYLGAYAGLVKSDADVLSANILPDPHDGIRVYVYGTPGETREIAVWSGNERGRGVDVTFAAGTPRVYITGLSQIVALPTDLAPTVWQHPFDDNAPVLIGPLDVPEHDATTATLVLSNEGSTPIYALRPDGSFDEIVVESSVVPAFAAPDFVDSDWAEIDDLSLRDASIGAGWYRSHILLPDGDGGDAQIDFPTKSNDLTVWVNGELAMRSATAAEGKATFDLRLRDGENTLCVLAPDADGLQGPVTLVPSGGCYLIDVIRWRYVPAAGEKDSVRVVHIAF